MSPEQQAARDWGCPCGICPPCSGKERYPDECDDCGAVNGVSDYRSPYAPKPVSLMLCSACADAEAQSQAERAAENTP